MICRIALVEMKYEEDKRRILEENPNISKYALEFILSLPVERKIPVHI